MTNFFSKVISSSASGLSTSSQRRNGTNLKLAERYICHRVPCGPWSGRMKLWEPERTRSLFGEGETNRHRHRDKSYSHGSKNACKEIPITTTTSTEEEYYEFLAFKKETLWWIIVFFMSFVTHLYSNNNWKHLWCEYIS